MPKRTRDYESDLVDKLKDPEFSVEYLNASLEDNPITCYPINGVRTSLARAFRKSIDDRQFRRIVWERWGRWPLFGPSKNVK